MTMRELLFSIDIIFDEPTQFHNDIRYWSNYIITNDNGYIQIRRDNHKVHFALDDNCIGLNECFVGYKFMEDIKIYLREKKINEFLL